MVFIYYGIHPKLDKLAEAEYLNYIRCVLCLAVCPKCREHLSKPVDLHGHLTLARKNPEGELEPAPNLIEQMNTCVAYLACNETETEDIRTIELIHLMRIDGE